MKLKIGDRIRVKPYNQVIDMYRRGKLKYLDREYPTDKEFVYGIEWKDYKRICELIGEITKINDVDYYVIFQGDRNWEFDIPPVLIQKMHNINLPDDLFEL